MLLLDPLSGKGAATSSRLGERARVLGHPGGLDEDLRELAEQAVAEGADVLGVAGGDGCQAVVADVARRHGLPFVCVPAGTRTHFARDLGLDRDDPAAALDAFGEAVERRVDLGVVENRVFVNNVSLGAYAAVVRAPGSPRSPSACPVCSGRTTPPGGGSTDRPAGAGAGPRLQPGGPPGRSNAATEPARTRARPP
ncbi:hypothetical protein MUY14_21685 [Amycolatopsis sp. FBCC-B4732]|uniref:diacylglycerol/lipid kinase family protein n=1 Tax=Amycolatopsis sp. FBCC-B4732 TaxID=3079339 RepID=UPI001FF393F0|nr:diacylglycerol kinase family protein [Amycolatopsis sp. FBCC-B4732]UOX93101.1 hypothetical protein MUY14_21685 [Amycolatopsis sp. FBCC-B4732]